MTVAVVSVAAVVLATMVARAARRSVQQRAGVALVGYDSVIDAAVAVFVVAQTRGRTVTA